MNTPPQSSIEWHRCYPRCEFFQVQKRIDFGYAVFEIRVCSKCGLVKHDWSPQFAPGEDRR